jgi:hypothetical protein
MAAVLGTTLIARAVPLAYSVSTGNEAASGVEDYLDWMVESRNAGDRHDRRALPRARPLSGGGAGGPARGQAHRAAAPRQE